MWIVTAAFDTEPITSPLSAPTKTKLLKPGSTYTLGRGEANNLIINSKKVSKELGSFTVDEFTVEDARDPTVRPALTFCSQAKPWGLNRGGDQADTIQPQTPTELQDGDRIHAAKDLGIVVQWQDVLCFSGAPKAKLPVDKRACASLGIHFTHEASATTSVTHYLVSAYAPTAIAASLLITSSHFVTPEWLEEVVRLGNSGALERHFTLPAPNKYRPSFSPSLLPAHQAPAVWAPNETRLSIFRNYRFLWIGEKAQEVPQEYRNLIARGEGAVGFFDVHSGPAKFQANINRNRRKSDGTKTLVAVAHVEGLVAAVGQSAWNEILQAAKKEKVHLAAPESLVQAALDNDTSILEKECEPIQVEQVVDETPQVEERAVSPPPEAPKRLRSTRNVARSEAPAADPPPDLSLSAAPSDEPPRRLKSTRRHVTPSAEGSVPPILDINPFLPPPPEVPGTLESTRTTPMRLKPTSRLKRRLPSAEPELATIVEDSYKEPPLKKFRALFDASAPANLQSGDIIDSQMADGEFEPPVDSQTQAETQTNKTQRLRSIRNLSALREEEEEDSVLGESVAAVAHGTKRSIEEVEENMAMEIDDSQQFTKKKRATEINRVAAGTDGVAAAPAAEVPAPSRGATSNNAPPSSPSKPTTTKPKAPGADIGKPDKDAAFLKALASTKRGKKHEDDFDREFNKLKISKPLAEKEGVPEEEEQWAVLAEFGDDSGIRGNFMNICELEIFAEKSGRENLGRREVRPEWRGCPNFKKFKKKDITRARPKVDLYYAHGDEQSAIFDDDEEGQSQGFEPFQGSSARPKLANKEKEKVAKGRSRSVIDLDAEFDDDDDADEPAAAPPNSKTMRTTRAGRAGSAKPPSVSTRAGSTAPPSKSQGTTSSGSTRTRTKTTAPTPKSKAKATSAGRGRGAAVSMIIEEDEEEFESPLFLEDEDQSQPSMTLGTATPSSRMSNVVDDDDEEDEDDDGGAFKKPARRAAKPNLSRPKTATTRPPVVGRNSKRQTRPTTFLAADSDDDDDGEGDDD